MARTPQTPPLSFRTDPETRAEIVRRAAEDGVSPNAWLLRIVSSHLGRLRRAESRRGQ